MSDSEEQEVNSVGSDAEVEVGDETEQEQEQLSYDDMPIANPLKLALTTLGWKNPTDIQRQVIPQALAGKDIIGLAETGSGKTGAFAIPVLHFLINNPSRLFGLVLTPTRELAFQINEVFDALGANIALNVVCIVGGIDMADQAIALAKKPHVIIATPGRLLDHLHNTKGFSLRTIKFLVLDEADRMLSMDFEKEINELLAVLPQDRKTYLFSATMTNKVDKLQKASLKNPAKVEVSNKFQTPKQLVQQYVFMPAKWKDCFMTYIVNEFKGQSIIIFVGTCNNALRTTLILRNLGFHATCLHGKLSQSKRLGSLNKFKAGQCNILVATDVASRGLDIPNVDVVINYDLPSHGKDYIHRVGRTARAGKAGRSLSFVTQYDVEAYQHLETMIGAKLPQFPVEEESALMLLERVSESQRMATRELKEQEESLRKKKKRKGGNDNNRDKDVEDDGEEVAEERSRPKKMMKKSKR